MRTFDFPQRSPEWWAIRRGIPTASGFSRIITSKGEPASAQAGYIAELVAEAVSDQPLPNYQPFRGKAVNDGLANEDEARRWYELEHGVEVTQVGFCLSDCDRYGCSPDGLVGDDGGIELKCPALKTHAAYAIKGTLPNQYKAQVHGSLIVTGRPWWAFVSYADGLSPFVVRVVPDEFTEKLRTELMKFLDKLDEAKARMIRKPEPMAF